MPFSTSMMISGVIALVASAATISTQVNGSPESSHLVADSEQAACSAALMPVATGSATVPPGSDGVFCGQAPQGAYTPITSWAALYRAFPR